MSDAELCGLDLPTYVEGFHNRAMVEKMRYRDLGNTGMKVSILSYGASSLGTSRGLSYFIIYMMHCDACLPGV